MSEYGHERGRMTETGKKHEEEDRQERSMRQESSKGGKKEIKRVPYFFLFLLMSSIPLKKLRYSSTSPKTKNPMKMPIPVAMVPP